MTGYPVSFRRLCRRRTAGAKKEEKVADFYQAAADMEARNKGWRGAAEAISGAD